jgi:hypothetical protein
MNAQTEHFDPDHPVDMTSRKPSVVFCLPQLALGTDHLALLFYVKHNELLKAFTDCDISLDYLTNQYHNNRGIVMEHIVKVARHLFPDSVVSGVSARETVKILEPNTYIVMLTEDGFSRMTCRTCRKDDRPDFEQIEIIGQSQWADMNRRTSLEVPTFDTIPHGSPARRIVPPISRTKEDQGAVLVDEMVSVEGLAFLLWKDPKEIEDAVMIDGVDYRNERGFIPRDTAVRIIRVTYPKIIILKTEEPIRESYAKTGMLMVFADQRRFYEGGLGGHPTIKLKPFVWYIDGFRENFFLQTQAQERAEEGHVVTSHTDFPRNIQVDGVAELADAAIKLSDAFHTARPEVPLADHVEAAKNESEGDIYDAVAQYRKEHPESVQQEDGVVIGEPYLAKVKSQSERAVTMGDIVEDAIDAGILKRVEPSELPVDTRVNPIMRIEHFPTITDFYRWYERFGIAHYNETHTTIDDNPDAPFLDEFPAFLVYRHYEDDHITPIQLVPENQITNERLSPIRDLFHGMLFVEASNKERGYHQLLETDLDKELTHLAEGGAKVIRIYDLSKFNKNVHKNKFLNLDFMHRVIPHTVTNFVEKHRGFVLVLQLGDGVNEVYQWLPMLTDQLSTWGVPKEDEPYLIEPKTEPKGKGIQYDAEAEPYIDIKGEDDEIWRLYLDAKHTYLAIPRTSEWGGRPALAIYFPAVQENLPVWVKHAKTELGGPDVLICNTQPELITDRNWKAFVQPIAVDELVEKFRLAQVLGT